MDGGGRGSGRAATAEDEDVARITSHRDVWLQKVFPDTVNSDGFRIERQNNLETLAIHACHSF
jgi:hypothetical protein